MAKGLVMQEQLLVVNVVVQPDLSILISIRGDKKYENKETEVYGADYNAC